MHRPPALKRKPDLQSAVLVAMGAALGFIAHMAMSGPPQYRGSAPAAAVAMVTSPSAGAAPPRVNALLRNWGKLSADQVYEWLLQSHPDPGSAIVVEIGSVDGVQCKAAHDAGFGRVVCFEPSPTNHGRAAATLSSVAGTGRVQLVQKAGYNQSGIFVDFYTTGSVFDHIGERSKGEESIGLGGAHPVKVETVALDDFFNSTDVVYVAKVDTQGSDGTVVQGMRRLLREKRMRFIILELWPMAMNRSTGCKETLHILASSGYTIYETMLHEGSQHEPLPNRTAAYNHPVDIDALCDWYISASTGPYGLWTDILAVSDPLLGAC